MNKKILYILMVLAMIAWGETWVNAKILSRYLSADELIFWRFLITTLGMIPILWYKKLSLSISLPNLLLALVSAIVLALYNNAFFMGTRYGLASFGGVLVTTLTPMITFLLISLLTRKKFIYQEIVGLLFGGIGTLIILEIWSFDANLIFSKGNIYYLVASLLWPILTIISAKQKNINSLIFTFYLFGFTSLIDLVFIDFQITNISTFDSKFLLNLILLSLYGTTFATTIYFIAVVELGSKVASSFFFLVPSSAIVFSIFFLNETINISLILGGVFTVLAVYILNQTKRTKDFK